MILTKSVVDFKNNYIINNKNIEWANFGFLIEKADQQ
jgi:hypothetical protein